MCPQCNAPLTPHQFARSIVCSYCGATVRLDDSSISVEKFREALLVWNSPASYGVSSWVSIGDSHWAVEKQLARGELSDVYFARRARWPTELVILKLLRNADAADLFENEWDVLQTLQHSAAPGADTFTRLLPQPVIHGSLNSGDRASVFRWTSGFVHTFEDVMRAYPQGITPQASIWIWRRILEVLSFLHASGMAHGAVLPENLLIQQNEHGVRLVGYSRAGRLGDRLSAMPAGRESFYPAAQTNPHLSIQLDLSMSARCIAALLAGQAANVMLPAAVPTKLAEIVRRIALADPAGKSGQDAWALRQELGQISSEVFGPARFIPIAMPS